jgi:CMP-N-acetylneuraminic acid synthetase
MIACLCPLRGGSKSIPKKNIRTIAGKPLSAWSLQAAASAQLIDEVYVSTDCLEIGEVVKQLGLGITVLPRSKELATDLASTELVMLDFLKRVSFDCLVTIQATSPLTTAKDLDLAITRFHALQLDSMLSAVRTTRFFWNDDATPLNYDPLQRPRRQDFRGTLMENGAFYITKRAVLERYQCRLGGRIGIFEMDHATSLEIDEPEDWNKVEALLSARVSAQPSR